MHEDFDFLAKFIHIEIWLILVSFAFLLLIRMITGQINLFGLITDKRSGGISVSRLQLLILTLASAGILFSDPQTLFNSDTDLVAMVFGGSQALYLYKKSKS